MNFYKEFRYRKYQIILNNCNGAQTFYRSVTVILFDRYDIFYPEPNGESIIESIINPRSHMRTTLS